MFALFPTPLTELSRHSRRHRNYHRPELYCQFCQRRFSKSYNLMVHERSHFEIHKSEVAYACDICGRSGFRSREQVREHRSQHSPGGSSTSSSSSSSSYYYY